ncbi:MAG: copper resistance protein CopC/CopD [Hamadaea sp.]|nr:copper resistance protein CopC/CopD [Hamadaea sp.]
MITIRRLAIPLVLLLAMLGFVAAPASAHAVLEAAAPAQNSTVATAPTELTLTFSESISPVKDKIRVIAPDGSRADKGDPAAEGTILRIPLRNDLPIGTYLVSYRVISADSHPVPGGFTFNVGAPSTPPTLTEGGGDTANRPIAIAIGVVKYLGYAGLLLAAGAALVMLLLWPARLPRTGARRLLNIGFGLLVGSTLAQFVLQAPYVNGTSLTQTTAEDLLGVFDSQFGAVLLARLGVLAVAAIVLAAALKRVYSHGEAATSDLVVLGVLFALGAATWPLAGHAAASPVPAVTVVVDAIHLGAMALWLGGLAVLGLVLLRPGQADDRELGAILPVWSRWATLAVSSVLLAGVVQALIEIGSLEALYKTTYGRLILVKVALVGVILLFAYVARRWVHRSAEDAVFAAAEPAQPSGVARHSGASPVRRAVLLELAVAAVILGVTAALTQTTPARVAVAEPSAVQPVQTYFTTSVKGTLYTLQVDVDPAKAGQNVVHLYAYAPDGKPVVVVEWTATAALPSAGIEPITVPLLPLTDNHSSGSVNLPAAGQWEFRFTLRLTDVDQETVTVAVPVG